MSDKKLEKKIKDMEQTIACDENMIQVRDVRIQELEFLLSAKLVEIKKLNDQIDPLKKDIADREQTISLLTHRLEESFVDNKQLRKEIDDLEENNLGYPPTCNEYISNLQAQIVELEQQKAKIAESLMKEVNKTKPDKEWMKKSEVWRAEKELLNDKIEELNEELERREGISLSDTCLIKSLENGYNLLERDVNFWKQHYFEAVNVVFKLNGEIKRRDSECND